MRRKANRPWTSVEGSTLKIAADGGAPARPRQKPYRERDPYTRAYNAGFNRVQGCA